jgi:hypothetical protein
MAAQCRTRPQGKKGSLTAISMDPRSAAHRIFRWWHPTVQLSGESTAAVFVSAEDRDEVRRCSQQTVDSFDAVPAARVLCSRTRPLRLARPSRAAPASC